MIKTLRLFFLSAMLVVCGTISAQKTVTFTAGEDKGTTTASAAGEDQITKDGVTIAISNGAMAEEQYRVYKNASFTVSSESGNITKIEVTCTANGTTKQGPGCLENPTSGEYTFEADGKNGTWTGSAMSVTFNCPSNQCRMTVVTVTVEAGDPNKLLTPAITGTTPFDGTTTVTISNPNERGGIIYAVNLTDPTIEDIFDRGRDYTAPFEVSETTTVYAIVFDEEKEDNSEMASKTFTKIEIASAENIAAFKALETGTEAKLTLTDAQVLYANTTDIFVRDASGAIDFYNTGLQLKAGQKVNGFVIGKLAVYNNMPELAKTSNTNADNYSTADGTATAKEIGLDEVASFACDLITIKDVTIVKEGNNYYATNEDGDKLQVYDKFKIGYVISDFEKAYTITGILIPYKDSYEIAPIEDFTDNEPQEAKDVTVAEALTIINALEEGATTPEIYNVKGYITTIDEINVEYGNATFDLADEANGSETIKVYRAKGLDNANITDENFVRVGDQVVVCGHLQKYVKNEVVTPEVSNGYVLSILATGISEQAAANEASAAIYNLAGQRVDNSYKGVVIQNGKKFVVK